METNLSISSFGEDRDGELYVVDIAGTVYRISAPVALTPGTGAFTPDRPLDLTITINVPDARVASVEMAVDGEPWADGAGVCSDVGRLPHGSQVLRCRDLGGLLAPGTHEITVVVELEDGRSYDAAVVWTLAPGASSDG